MGTLATIDPASAPPPGLADLDNAQLRAALSKSLSRTAAELLRLAWIVRILEDRGEDLSDLRLDLIAYLRQIAYGQIVPEAVVRFSGSTRLLDVVCKLPIPDQKRIAAGEPVKLMVRGKDGAMDHRLVDPSKLIGNQFAQVFAKGRIRTDAEQILFLESHLRDNPPLASAPPKRGRIQADKKRGGLFVGRIFVSAADVLAALADLNPGKPSDVDLPTAAVVGRITPIEHRRLSIALAKSRMSIQDAVRYALLVTGMLAPHEGE